MLKGKKILVGVSGSVAAYKACEIVSLLVKAHADVHVILTENGEKFVPAPTFAALTGNHVYIDCFDIGHEYQIPHIRLAERADLFLVAPASADIIGKIANGISDNMLVDTFIASDCPKLIAPAMNTVMYENPANKRNMNLLKEYGYKIIEPSSGHLACGVEGKGKLPDPLEIFQYVLKETTKKDLKGKNILVTAGPTVEDIDPVRFISNHSSGKMGYELARAASYRGANVSLVSGPSVLPVPIVDEFVAIHSAKDMFNAVKDRYSSMDIIIKSAAVADYTPISVSDEKIKKMEGDSKIALKRTDDILKFLGENRKEGQFICGFSMETENMIENSKKKLLKKNIDMIVANNLKDEGAGFGVDSNLASFIKEDSVRNIPLMSKWMLANKILDEILDSIEN